MADPTFTALATKSAKQYRPPDMASGKRGAAALVRSLAVTPPVPIAAPAVPAESDLAYTGQLWETWSETSTDIETGDTISFGPGYSVQYAIREVERLPFGAGRVRIVYHAPLFAPGV